MMQFFQTGTSTFPKCEVDRCIYHALKGSRFCRKHESC